MKNITLSVEEHVLDQVRVVAANRRTTVNRLVRDYLAQVARSDKDVVSTRDRLLELIDKSGGRLGPAWKWNREDAYEDRVLPGHKRPPLRRARKT